MPPHPHPPDAATASASPFRVVPGEVQRWQPAPFSIDPWIVLRLSRYRRREEVPPPVWAVACDMAARGERLVEPCAIFTVVEVATAGVAGARLSSGPAFSGQGIGRLLAGCSHALPFVLTVGPALDVETRGLSERGELLEAFLLDTAGWAAVETTVRTLRTDLRGWSRAGGWRLTHRLGPGYLDWPLSEQPRLLDLLGDTGKLVRVSEHGVLVPLKSLTGVFGLARD